jgi:DNA polymerase-3 subunit chi
VIEIVNQEPDLLTACRENFRSYRQRGYDPKRVEL